MYGPAVAPARTLQIRYDDHGARVWLLRGAPCRWRGHVTIEFHNIAFNNLQCAISLRNPQTVSSYEERLRRGGPIAPLIVSETGRGTYYVHDGNHRCEALRSMLSPDARVRVAVVRPRPGYRFQWRWFGSYGTYLLEPEGLCRVRPARKDANRRTRLSPLLGRTLVLVAHPDDETGGCAALLQRVREPIVVFATDGAPGDEFFWRLYGSREAYSQIRKNEARRALTELGVKSVHFLCDHARGVQFRDQQLHVSLRSAIAMTMSLVERYKPDAILVPAYEGGHPDHDTCSFIGAIIGQLTALPIWEMPLYHRSSSGELVCQRFRDLENTEVLVRLTDNERLNRNVLIGFYGSQTDLGEFITSNIESFRPQHRYDFSQAPHEGAVNYQYWGWPISPQDLCRRFSECAAKLVPEPCICDSIVQTARIAADA